MAAAFAGQMERDGAQAMRAMAMGGSLDLLGSGGGGKSERREEDEG